jgi:peptide/nickel transport system substrate-binding protein
MTHRTRRNSKRNAITLLTWTCSFILGALAPVVFGVTASAAETKLTVAVQTLPAALGNVHRSTSSSELYTWSAIFEPLTMVEADGSVSPWLMESWEAVNPTTWHFKLRQGVSFQNGEPFNADAVINTVTYLTSEAGLRESLSRVVSSISGVKALGPYEVEITTHYPNLMLPAELGIIRMVAPRQWRELGADGFAREPIGSGPYKVEDWSAGKIELSAFHNVWNAPGVDALDIIQLGDPTTRTQAILAGSADIAIVIGPDEVIALQAAGHTHHVSQGAGAMGVAWLPAVSGPIADVRVRRALNHAVNREAYIAALLNGGTQPATQATPSNAVGWDPSLPAWDYDPGKAKAMLDEAGYGNGFKLVAELATGGAAADGAIYQIIAQDLARIGVTFEVRSITIPEMIRNFNYGGWEGEGFNMDFNTKPSLDALRPFAACLLRELWHCRKELEPITRAALAEWDAERRLALVRQLLKAYHDDPPMLFLHDTIMFDGLSSRVRGYEPINLIINYHDLTVGDEQD